MRKTEQKLEIGEAVAAANSDLAVVNDPLPPLTKAEVMAYRNGISNLQLMGVRDQSLDKCLSEEQLAYGYMSFLGGIDPQDAIEEMIALQMIGLHNAAVDNLRMAGSPNVSLAVMPQLIGSANKCSRSFATLLESLHRHRGNAQQKVVVEHVHVHAGGQAIVGNVEGGAGGRGKKGK